MRYPKACRQCRESKRKCAHQGIDKPCASCAKRRLRCTLSLHSTTGQSSQLAPRVVALNPQSEQRSACTPISKAVKAELVDLYLEKLHDRPHSLFHVATLKAQVQSGGLDRALLLAVCSTASRFSQHAETRQLECQLMDESKRLLLANLEDICIENVQCCILIANLSAAHLNPKSEALFFRIANGMAQILGLDAAPSCTLPIAEREVRRRVWWTLVMADRWSSSGLALPRQIPELDGPVDLPMDEAMFQSLPADQGELETAWTPGLWAQMILLVGLFGPIQDLNRRSAAGDIGADELSRNVDNLSQKLQYWEDGLPSHFRMTEENFDFHRSRGTGGTFVALHLGFYHYSALLFFQFLERGDSSRHVEKCKRYAAAYSDLLRRSRSKGDCHALYATVAHMAVVSSSVLLHTLVFGENHELSTARDLLNSNFEAILELQKYWPSCALMISRLVTFQNSCLLAEAHTHLLDGWMVRFLMEHSLPLEDKEFFALATGVSPRPSAISIRAQELTEQGRYTMFDLPTAHGV